ncbi:3-deoxy-D-manno-octulosonic acid transferase [Vibrio ponticus]|uniref:3-deoxy-D-manno-octulosonic acid transferase n=1 Tax=Vibrio ponticus TaxID=265668 RepID=A0ABX3FC55_9VIBR|nr:lipid IV(A) 3-deoxy-D-manno-octulosonic acid transferase [Vibrio ponticus]OLQ86627.1 3-deoxy-D-manno-octulosonic acid transferase [Vibrio ponticus]
MRILYNLLLILLSPVLLFSLYKKKEGKPSFSKRWKEHFGICPKYNGSSQPVWIHAVSVGESIAAIPLIRAIKQSNPKQNIVVTTTTSTGAAQIEKLGNLVEHRYMPIDFTWAINGFLNAIKPSQLLIIETELWPNTLHQLGKKHIPITVVNARLSEKSCRNYEKVGRLFKQMQENIDQILCQSEADAKRFARLGVDNQKLQVTGSIKFDIQISKHIQQQGRLLREHIGSDRPVWIAASTHAGEDEIILSSHRRILDKNKEALLIIVPRHPERFNDVYQLSIGAGFNVARRTVTDSLNQSSQVYLADTMGEMLILLSSADICFMGGSLLGKKVGGHNLLEPTAVGIPSITGPSYFNFKEITEALVEEKIVSITSSEDEIANSLEQFWQSDSTKVKQRALQFIAHQGGAIQKSLSHIKL